jgi:hypothetical protein
MKLVATVLMLSAVPLCEVRAEEAIAQDHRLAQTQQQKSESLPTGSCMPIGLTARGEIVFPWECRELIEKQRGPVSEEIPKPSKDSVSKESAASPSPGPEQVFATPDLSPAPPQAPAANDQPSERGPHAKKLSGRRQKKHDDTALQSDTKITGALKTGAIK